MEEKRKWSILALQPFFPGPHRASSSAKLLRGTTTKVECVGGEKNEKKKWKFTKSTAKLATEKKTKQKRKRGHKNPPICSKKKRANANGVAEETTKNARELRTPRLAEVWLKEFIHLSSPHG